MTRPRRGLARALFADSSGFFAAANRSDDNHEPARRILERAANSSVAIVTTSYVVAETHALFLSKAGREQGIRFLRSLDGSSIRVVRPAGDDEERARAIIYGYADKDFSLTDALSFAVMERLGISTAFTFDRDFQRYGFTAATG